MLRPRYPYPPHNCPWLPFSPNIPLHPFPLPCRPNTSPIDPNAGAKCQKCLQAGHWTYDCPNQRAYRPRPTRSALLANPNLRLPEATMPSVDLEKERENAIADILGPQRDAPEKEEKAQESDDSGTTDYESDSDLTTDTEAEATTEENQVSTARSLVHARDDPHEAEVKADSSSGFSSSEDSESETPLKRSKN